MFARINNINNLIWSSLEECLVPPLPYTNKAILKKMLGTITLFPLGLISSALEVASKIAAYPFNLLQSKDIDPKNDFTAVLHDSRLWSQLGDIEEELLSSPFSGERSNFAMGMSTCTYQDSGSFHCKDSQWVDWEEQCIEKENRSYNSGNLFELYQSEVGRMEIVKRLKLAGVDSYRFSFEWSQFEPNKGEFHEEVLMVYKNLCRFFRDHGIKPMITLHHFSEPKWFHNMGSFEKEENLQYFIRFSVKVFTELTKSYRGEPLVSHFCTINEPAIEAFSRYIRGAFSPGFIFRIQRAGYFLKGALEAHRLVYDKLKQISPSVQIGITHQYLRFIPSNSLLFLVTRYLTRIVNDVSLNFFKSGIFELKIPFFCHIYHKSSSKPKTDFVGVQYYARPVIGVKGPESFYEPMTQMPFREDPEGLYEAIVKTYEAFQKPVIITENGISTNNDEQRSRYMLRALYSAKKAQEAIGAENLKGYFLWSFVNNLEWDMGMNPQAFGAYALEHHNGEVKIADSYKKGIEPFVKVSLAIKKLHLQQKAS